MRSLKKNKQTLKYALLIGKLPVYALDENGNKKIAYTKKDGTVVYEIVGDKEMTYTTPKEFDVNIAMSGGEAEAREFGLSTSDYEAILSYSKGAFPLVEGALIWHHNKVGYRNDGQVVEIQTKDGKVIKTKNPDPFTADYSVIKIPQGLNEERAILKAVVNNKGNA